MQCFLSYNSKDKPTAERVGVHLLQRNISAWLDMWDIKGGDSLTDKIADGIDHSDAFLIFLSGNSEGAPWVKEELRIAIQKRIRNEGYKIIPILLSECKIPAFLRDYLYIDWREGEETALQKILHALSGYSNKPVVDYKEAGHVLAYATTKVDVIFHGRRGHRTVFKESHRYKVLREFRHLNKRLYYDGACTYVRNDAFNVTRIPKSPTYEELRYDLRGPVKVGDWLEVNEEYELTNNFREISNHWIQHVESPIADQGELSLNFDFSDASDIAEMVTYLRESPRPILDNVQPTRVGDRFVWKKSFLTFGEQFTFRFRWSD